MTHQPTEPVILFTQPDADVPREVESGAPIKRWVGTRIAIGLGNYLLECLESMTPDTKTGLVVVLAADFVVCNICGLIQSDLTGEFSWFYFAAIPGDAFALLIVAVFSGAFVSMAVDRVKDFVNAVKRHMPDH